MGNFGLKMHWQKKIWARAHFQNGRQIVVFLPFWRYKYLYHYSRMGWYSKIPIIIMNPHDMYYHLMTLPKNGPQKNGTAHAHHLLERMLMYNDFFRGKYFSKSRKIYSGIVFRIKRFFGKVLKSCDKFCQKVNFYVKFD